MVDGLPFVSCRIKYAAQELRLDNVLVDTGSAGTVFNTDVLLAIGIRLELTDTFYRVSGVGGYEPVFGRKVDVLSCDDMLATDFEVEVGPMKYAQEFNGILGMNFLQAVGAVIDVKHQTLGKVETKIEDARAEAKYEVARTLFAEGLNKELIVRTTGFSLKELSAAGIFHE